MTNVSLDQTIEVKRVKGKASSSSVEAVGGSCPDVSFQLTLDYSGDYTINDSNKPSQAETLSAPTGSTPVTSTSQQTTGVSQ